MDYYKELIEEVLSVSELKIGKVSNDKVIEKYWILRIELPDSRNYILSVISYNDCCDAVFIVDYGMAVYFHKQGVKSNVARIKSDAMAQHLKSLSLYPDTSGGCYDCPSYDLVMQTPNSTAKLWLTNSSDSQFSDLIRAFRQFVTDLNLQYESKEIAQFIETWNLYEGK